MNDKLAQARENIKKIKKLLSQREEFKNETNRIEQLSKTLNDLKDA